MKRVLCVLFAFTCLSYAIETECHRPYYGWVRKKLIEGNIEKVLEKVGPDTKLGERESTYWTTGLHVAAELANELGKPEILEAFINKGFDVNKKDVLGTAPLFSLLYYEFPAEKGKLVSMLVGAGASLLESNAYGRTPREDVELKLEYMGLQHKLGEKPDETQYLALVDVLDVFNKKEGITASEAEINIDRLRKTGIYVSNWREQ